MSSILKCKIDPKTTLPDNESYKVTTYTNKNLRADTIISKKFIIRGPRSRFEVSNEDDEKLWHRIFGIVGGSWPKTTHNNGTFNLNVLFQPVFDRFGSPTNLIALRLAWRGLNNKEHIQPIGHVAYNKMIEVTLQFMGGRIKARVNDGSPKAKDYAPMPASLPRTSRGIILPPRLNPAFKSKVTTPYYILLKDGNNMPSSRQLSLCEC